jgi:hypothetical protein
VLRVWAGENAGLDDRIQLVWGGVVELVRFQPGTVSLADLAGDEEG